VHFAQVDRQVVLCGKRLRASRHSALHSPGVTDLLNASLHRGPDFLRQDTQRDPTSPAPSSTFPRTRSISTNRTNETTQITHASEDLFLFGAIQRESGGHHGRRSPTFSTRTRTTTTTTGLFSRFLSGLITGTPNTTKTQQRRH
jgi:hypothetical protein